MRLVLLIKVSCPSCGLTAETSSFSDESGLHHAQPMTKEALRPHANCDLWLLSRSLSNEAYLQSKPKAFFLKGT
jgi:hypothetical protein